MKKKLLCLIMLAVMFAFPFLVSAEEAVAKIGDKSYATLIEAVENVGKGETITVLKDTESVGIVVETGSEFTLDLGGHTVTFTTEVGSKGTETLNLQLLKDSTLVFKNGTLKSSTNGKVLIQNYSNLTLEDVTLNATNDKMLYALSINNGTVFLKGETNIFVNEGVVAFDAYWWPQGYEDGAQVTVDTTGVVEGNIEVAAQEGADLDASKTILRIKNINHVGEMSIQEGLEANVILEDGTYTDSAVMENVATPEGSDVYQVANVETGETKYVVATEEELEAKVFEDEESVMTAEEFEEALKELEASESEEDKALLAEIKKALEGKSTISSHNILYGSFIEESLVVSSIQTELEKAVKVTLSVPETLEKVKDGYNRKYSVVRLHWDQDTQKMVVDVLDAKENKDGTVSFETDKFSTYILTYEDVKDTTNPNTFDGISSIMVVACLSLVSLLAVALYAKNKKVFN